MTQSNIIAVSADGTAKWRGTTYRCALGSAGVTARKREGDHASPMGCFALRRVLFRPDREPAPETLLPAQPLRPDFGWCDDPASASYNQAVTLPFAARAEAMWREDAVYDLVVVIGHNDSPVVPGCGSAIFLHVARDGYAPTEGCIAFAREDLIAILRDCGTDTRVCIL
jgi:L,D-peptidoglycan transpeptidase YkuD (ErfK/YbiS/YcfS/YnhG family)